MATDAEFRTPILLPGNPTSALHAATKQYVDNNAGGVIYGTDPSAAPNNSMFYDTDTPTPLFDVRGSGSPEGVVAGEPGCVWRQTDHATWGYLKWVKASGTGSTGWYPDFEGRPPYAISTVRSATGSGWQSIPITLASSRGITTPNAGRYNVPFPGLYRFSAYINTRSNTQTRLILAAKADGSPAPSSDDWISDNPANLHSTVKIDTVTVLLNVSAFVGCDYYTDVANQVVYLKTTLVYEGQA